MLDFLGLIQPPLSYVVFGALGGFLYILRQSLMRHKVAPIEFIARPAFGAVAAYILTVSLHLPNHLTSLFSGYAGIDIFDAALSRFNLPAALGFLKHVPADPPAPPAPASLALPVDDLPPDPAEAPPK